MSRETFPVPYLERDVAIYLAGLIDGEGTFIIQRNARGQGYTYNSAFKLVLTDEATIEWVSSKLQRPYSFVNGNESKNQRAAYCIRISDHRGLIDFIEQILPFMIVKREAAETIIAFCKSRIAQQQSKYHSGYSDFDISRWKKIKKLNKVGIQSE